MRTQLEIQRSQFTFTDENQALCVTETTVQLWTFETIETVNQCDRNSVIKEHYVKILSLESWQKSSKSIRAIWNMIWVHRIKSGFLSIWVFFCYCDPTKQYKARINLIYCSFWIHFGFDILEMWSGVIMNYPFVIEVILYTRVPLIALILLDKPVYAIYPG